MNHTLAWLLLLGMLGGCATAPSVETRIRSLEQQQVAAAIARDRTALEQLFAPDFRIINPAGAVASKNELLALLTGGVTPYRSAVYETDAVRVYGDVVVSTGTETVVPAQGAQAGQQVKRRITHVWEKHGGAWQLVLRHATVVSSP
jgi:uncharacterized protein (TIGR02246 family)